MLSGIETAVKRVLTLPIGAEKLAQTTARKVKEKREISRTLSEAKKRWQQSNGDHEGYRF